MVPFRYLLRFIDKALYKSKGLDFLLSLMKILNPTPIFREDLQIEQKNNSEI